MDQVGNYSLKELKEWGGGRLWDILVTAIFYFSEQYGIRLFEQ
jgi:hypothetical protein